MKPKKVVKSTGEKLLLLYDTQEQDLARDLKELLEEVGVQQLELIPLSANHGITLEEKERQAFESASAVIFLLTPGAERLGKLYPSPSVTHEMGQAKQKFAKRRSGVIYLMDSRCAVPAIDQQAYILFRRDDMRSVLSAVTQLFKELKASGSWTALNAARPASPPLTKSQVNRIIRNVAPPLREAIYFLGNCRDGIVSDAEFMLHLMQSVRLDAISINFLKRDLVGLGFASFFSRDRSPIKSCWQLTELGWRVVQREAIRRNGEREQAVAKFQQTVRAAIERRRKPASLGSAQFRPADGS